MACSAFRTSTTRNVSNSPAAVNKKLIRQPGEYRSRSTRLFGNPAGPLPSTSYTEDYRDPQTQWPHYRSTPRSPTNASGHSHPNNVLMTYHLNKRQMPRKKISLSTIMELEEQVKEDDVKRRRPTTYQEDYINYRSRENVRRERIPAPKREADLPPINTTTNRDYKAPVPNYILNGESHNRSSNVDRVKAAKGALPMLLNQTLPPMSKHKTLYASEFGSSGPREGGEKNSDRNAKEPKAGSVHLPALVNSHADKNVLTQ